MGEKRGTEDGEGCVEDIRGIGGEKGDIGGRGMCGGGEVRKGEVEGNRGR